MIEIIKELNIEVSKPNVFQAVVAKQYDMNTRFIKATFVDNGEKVNIDQSDTLRVTINATRNDGLAKGFDGVINDDGTVTVPLHSWMLELAGTVLCDISVIDLESNDNKKLTTTSFTLLVEKAAWDGDGITSDPQYDLLIELLNTCATAGERAEEALVKSNSVIDKFDACVEATEQAVEATQTLVLTHEDFVSGGYVEALKEMNNGGRLLFWVGTEEEFAEDKDNMPDDTFCITTDGTTLEELLQVINNVKTNDIQAFGLGSSSPKLWSEVDDLVNNGWYYFSTNVVVNDISCGEAYLRVDSYNRTNVTQTLYLLHGSKRYTLVRHKIANVWENEWGWVNPPLLIAPGEEVGVEYKTTELWYDKYVYTRRIRFVAENGRELSITPWSNDYVIIRQAAFNSISPLPFFGTSGEIKSNLRITPTTGSIHYLDIRTEVTGNVWVQIWYTKD